MPGSTRASGKVYSVFYLFDEQLDRINAMQRLTWFFAIKHLRACVFGSTWSAYELVIVFDESLSVADMCRMWELASPGEVSVLDDDCGELEEEVKELYLMMGGFMGWLDVPVA